MGAGDSVRDAHLSVEWSHQVADYLCRCTTQEQVTLFLSSSLSPLFETVPDASPTTTSSQLSHAEHLGTKQQRTSTTILEDSNKALASHKEREEEEDAQLELKEREEEEEEEEGTDEQNHSDGSERSADVADAEDERRSSKRARTNDTQSHASSSRRAARRREDESTANGSSIPMVPVPMHDGEMSIYHSSGWRDSEEVLARRRRDDVSFAQVLMRVCTRDSLLQGLDLNPGTLTVPLLLWTAEQIVRRVSRLDPHIFSSHLTEQPLAMFDVLHRCADHRTEMLLSVFDQAVEVLRSANRASNMYSAFERLQETVLSMTTGPPSMWLLAHVWSTCAEEATPTPLSRYVHTESLPAKHTIEFRLALAVTSACVRKCPTRWSLWLAGWLSVDTDHSPAAAAAADPSRGHTQEEQRKNFTNPRALAQLVFANSHVFSASVGTLLNVPPAQLEVLLDRATLSTQDAPSLSAELVARLQDLLAEDIAPLFCYLDRCRDPTQYPILALISSTLMQHTAKQILCDPELKQAQQLGPPILPQLQTSLYTSLIPRLLQSERQDAHHSQLGSLCLAVSLANGRRASADLIITLLTSSRSASSLLYCQRVASAAEELLTNIVEQTVCALFHALPSFALSHQLNALENLATVVCAEDALFASAIAACWEDLLLATAPTARTTPTAHPSGVASSPKVLRAFALLAHLTIPHIIHRYQVQTSAEVLLLRILPEIDSNGCTPFGHKLKTLAVELCALHDVSLFAHMAELLLDLALGRHHEQFDRPRSGTLNQHKTHHHHTRGRSHVGASTLAISASATTGTFASETHSTALQRQHHTPVGLGALLVRLGVPSDHSTSSPSSACISSGGRGGIGVGGVGGAVRGGGVSGGGVSGMNSSSGTGSFSRADPTAIASLFSCLVRAEDALWNPTVRCRLGVLSQLLCNRCDNRHPVPNEEAYGQLLPSKLAFPRDQEIFKLFAEHPVLWQLLELVASEGGSVLCEHLDNVRSLLATLICYWHARSGAALERFRAENRRVAGSSSSYGGGGSRAEGHTGSGSGSRSGSGDGLTENALLQTCRLLELLRAAHWLPTPLCHLPHVIGSLQNASEVTAVLLDVWNFLRDFPPTRDQFAQPPTGEVSRRLWPHNFSSRPYTLTLTKMLRKHVISLGSHFGRFFVQTSELTDSGGLLPPPTGAEGLLPLPVGAEGLLPLPTGGGAGLLPTPELDEEASFMDQDDDEMLLFASQSNSSSKERVH